MITFPVFWQKMREIAEKKLGYAVDDEDVAFAWAALEVLDLQVATNGEIVDPRPAPAAGPNRGWTPPGDNSRFRGRRRR